MSILNQDKKIAFLAVVIGDIPIYLKDLRNEFVESPESQNEFILYASLDMLEEKRWQTNQCYLGVVKSEYHIIRYSLMIFFYKL